MLSPVRVFAASYTSENVTVTVTNRTWGYDSDGDIVYSMRYTVSTPNFSRDKDYLGYISVYAPITLTYDNAYVSGNLVAQLTGETAQEIGFTFNYDKTFVNNNNYYAGQRVRLYVYFYGFIDSTVYGSSLVNTVSFKITCNGLKTNGSQAYTVDTDWRASDLTSNAYIASIQAAEVSLTNIEAAVQATSGSLIAAIQASSALNDQDLVSLTNQVSSSATRQIENANANAAIAHSDAEDIKDLMTNDDSGFSDNQDDFKDEIDVAQSEADAAVDGAVHEYSDDLDTVTDFNWRNFFTAQSTPSAFWRDVGEFILDPNNLGFISTGLIIVTVIGVFVFALRL